MIWSFLLPIILLGCFVAVQRRQKIHRHGQPLKSAPDTLPLLGNAIKFLQPRHVLFDWFVQCQKQFGNETFEISVPSLPPGVVISSPVNVEFVLKNESHITKGDFFKVRSWDLFGHGIINASGDMWKAQRKAGLKFFSGANLEAMVEEVLPDTYSKMVSCLDKAIENRGLVDMQKVFLDFTTSAVGQMAYDMDIDAESPFSKAFDYASDHVGLRFQNPLYWLTELFTGSKFREAIFEVKKFGGQIVKKAKIRRSHIAFESLITTNEPIFGSLIDSLIEAFEDPKTVADSALNFLSAGRDTTAQSFTWTLYAILRHPEVIVRLRREIEDNDPTNDSKTRDEPTAQENPGATAATRNTNIADLQPSSIPYTMSVFYESLRLYPPVPFELKQCETDITLPDGTFLPRTSIVVWCIWAMNRSSQIWGSDADSYRPERWLVVGDETDDVDEATTTTTATHNDSNNTSSKTTTETKKEKLLSRSAFEFPVFNGGPRACLGKKMAELMAAYLFVNLLQDFDFEEIHQDDPLHPSSSLFSSTTKTTAERKKERKSQNSLTLPMEGGLPCRVVRRRR